MNKNVILAIDQGSSGTRAFAVDASGAVLYKRTEVICAEHPREIAQNGRLAAPGRRDEQHTAQPVREAGAEDLFPAADHLVRDADVQRGHVFDGKALPFLIDEYAGKADALAARARQKAAPQLFGHRIDGVLARAGDDLADVRIADGEGEVARRGDAQPSQIPIFAAVVDDDGLARAQAQLVDAVDIDIAQRLTQRFRQKCEHRTSPPQGLSCGASMYIYGPARPNMPARPSAAK